MPETITEWDDLRFFMAAWKARSFSRAAEALGVGQATVSRRMAALESRIGHPLFERTAAGLRATAAGELLHPYAEAVANTVLQAAARIEGFDVEPEGNVRLALSAGLASQIVPAYLPRLVRRHPKLRLDVVTAANADVGAREADVAVRTSTPESGDVLVRRLADVSFDVFASRAFVRALPRRVAIADLDFVGWSGASAGIPPAEWLRARTTRPPVVTVDDTVAMGALARHGLGAVVFPELLAAGAGLVRVPLGTEPPPTMPFYLVTHRALRHVPRVAAVVDFLLEVVAATPRVRRSR